MAAILKVEKSQYLDNALTACWEIWHDYAIWHSTPCGRL